MTPEGADYLRKARSHVAKAHDLLQITEYYDEVARLAYLAGLNAAQALIFSRGGRTPKTHRGVRTALALLVKDDPMLDRVFVRFLAEGYTYKEIADYGLDPGATVGEANAREAIDLALRFIARIEEILA